MQRRWVTVLAAALLASGASAATSEGAPRARDLGIVLAGQPGPLNAITDVSGVQVGHVSLLEGETRTGVTAILPLGPDELAGVPAGVAVFNGTGELTGAHLIREFGTLFGPILLTGTLGVGTARDGALLWSRDRISDPIQRASRMLPVVAETDDSGLSDAWRLPLTRADVLQALEGARPGPLQEGSVGGGTGMVCYQFKCGIGTASREVTTGIGEPAMVGVLVQANFGRRDQLTVAGVPVGRSLTDDMPRHAQPASGLADGDGSLVVIIASNAPLLPTQLERLARRATIGMARTGTFGTATSGDIFLAFSTATSVPFATGELSQHAALPNEMLDPLLAAAAQATEEAILNALVAGEDMDGRGGSKVFGLPHERLQQLLRQSKE